ncbi:MAG: Platinum sensitivity protein [Sclerophora amabilis]|nr:MAG: Platinum sensitivity protein [Sclerophora amabilis]
MALAVPNPPSDRKRVKVYELRNNDWFDRGTGFCTGHIANDEPRIFVESEEQPERMLLETRIAKEDGYQKQQDTLIVWTEPNGTDMALSFQEAEGCAAIWEFVDHVRQQLTALGGPDDALSDDAIESFSNPVMLPSPELGNLTEIEHLMRGASATQPGRDSLSKFIVSEDYIPKLIPLVEMAEDLESLTDLHRLCNIMKTLILLNDTAIIEYVVTDDIILGVVGALEYDPDFPSHKANHRHYLSDESKYKEVVRIEDPNVRKKIHHTYRLQYLKDVVLARILDDPTFSVLNSLIFFNQVDIVQHLQANGPFLKELFGVFGQPELDPPRKKNAVLFIQQCCAIAKNLQAPARSQLYANFIQNGLFQVINFALRHQDASVRIAGTDVLVAMIDHDPGMMRAFIFKQLSDKVVPLTDTLIELLLVEVDLGVKAQIADAIKVLLDPQANNPQPEALVKANEIPSKFRSQHESNGQTDAFLHSFYDESARKLFKPLKDLEERQTVRNFSVQEVSLYSHLVEILCFFIRQHVIRSKYFVLHEGLAARIGQLLACPEKHLKLTALKFFRTCVGLQDDFYNRQITASKLFGPILDIVYETMPRDNLLNSACLELFEFIKRENLKYLVSHVVENYRDKIKDITYVDTFQTLVLRYDQMHSFHPEMDHSFASTEEDTTPNKIQVNGNRRWQGVKDMDAAEEAYFNTSDDEEEAAAAAPTSSTSPIPSKAMTNGKVSSPASNKPLVDYPDDDDGDAMDTKEGPASPSSAARSLKPSIEPTSSPPSTPGAPNLSSRNATPLSSTPPTPPERLSEKRRREEDEDDELGKLSHNKRRSGSSNSISSSLGGNTKENTSAATPVHNTLRRKKSFTSGGKDGAAAAAANNGHSPAKKIAISLAIKNNPHGVGGIAGKEGTTEAGGEKGGGGGGGGGGKEKRDEGG